MSTAADCATQAGYHNEGRVKTRTHSKPRSREHNQVHPISGLDTDYSDDIIYVPPSERPLYRRSRSSQHASTAAGTQVPTSSPPRDARGARVRPESEAESLYARLDQSSLNDRQGNHSTTPTQPSASSNTLKRTTDDMQGPDAADGPPAKQPYSHSPKSRNRQGRTPSRRDGAGSSPHYTRPATGSSNAQSGLNSYYHPVTNDSDGKSKDVEPTMRVSTLLGDDDLPTETKFVKQPETRPITEQQLINEVKGIYAGLVMVERKCVDIINQQTQSPKRLTGQQWKALVALHRTLLQEHHDFFSASQHPSASDNLKRLAVKYAMPARMWRHGIHAFLELLRHRLPDSMEHMLSFIYLAYSMMALLKESVPSFVETWIECLGDLARYRMAIEDTDPRDREIWSNVAKMWYNEAADKSPNVGRIQHHLAVLARPNIVEQLFYYEKALVSVNPFVNARESIMLLFDMFLKNGEAVQARYHPTEFAFVNTHAQTFTHGSPAECGKMLELLRTNFGGYLDRAGPKFKTQGVQMAVASVAGFLDSGKEDSRICNLYRQYEENIEAWRKTQEDPSAKSPDAEVEQCHAIRNQYWHKLQGADHNNPVERLTVTKDIYQKDHIASSEDAVALNAPVFFETVSTASSKIGNTNIVPMMHVVLANLYDMSFVPDVLVYMEACVPWVSIVSFLNTVGRSGVSLDYEKEGFPRSHGVNGKQLPEDFLLRGLRTTQNYYHPQFFSGDLVDEDERSIELPSHQSPRAERCLWLGVRLAKLGRYFTYDEDKKVFETTEFVRSLTMLYV